MIAALLAAKCDDRLGRSVRLQGINVVVSSLLAVISFAFCIHSTCTGFPVLD